MSKEKQTTDQQLKQFYKWNVWLAVLHAVQGIVILLLSASRPLPVNLNFLGLDTLASQGKSQPVLAAGTHHLLDVNLAYLVAAFFFVTAVAHGLAATKLRPVFEKELKARMNTIRWIECAASAAIMLVVIGLLCGAYDLLSLCMLASLGAIMSLLGLAIESRTRGTKQAALPVKLTTGVALFAGLVPWFALAAYLVATALYGNGVRGFVLGIFVSIFLFFAGFAANIVLQYRKKGKWADYAYGERVYMLLNLAAKTALAWQIFAGVLRP